MKRSFFLTIAAGLLVAGIGALDARAASVALPTTLDNLLPAGTTTTVVGAETLTFSNFTYSSSSSPPPGSPGPAASIFTVNPFAVGSETGFSLNGTLNAPANTFVDVSISYVVTAPAGESINDAVLITTGSSLGGTGTYAVSETLNNAVTFAPVAALDATSASSSDSATFTGVNSILVTKDIFLSGGSNGETLSFVTQGFSSTAVPEPASMALLGIGMTSFLAFRRFFKRTNAA
jgi:hypothetical protein